MPYLANLNVRWGEFDFSNLREMRFEPHEIEQFGLKYGDIVMCAADQADVQFGKNKSRG